MLLHWMANFKCILCSFKIQNTVFVFKYSFPHSILYLYFKNNVQCIYISERSNITRCHMNDFCVCLHHVAPHAMKTMLGI